MLTKQDLQIIAGSARFKKAFLTGMKEYKPIYPLISMEQQATDETENYPWFTETPLLQLWQSERQRKAIEENSISVTNARWEITLAVDSKVFLYDKENLVKPRMQNMGRAVPKSYDKILVDLIETGESTLTYDGQNFFDTDHQEGDSATQSNLKVSTAASAANLSLLYETILAYEDDKGVNRGARGTHVMFPTSLSTDMLQYLEWELSRLNPDSSENVVSFLGLKPILNPFLANEGTPANSAYYMMDLSNVIKPFIYQWKTQPEFTAMDSPTAQRVFDRGEIEYGIQVHMNFGFGAWYLCIKARGTS